MTDRNAASSGPHIPVLLKPLLEAVAPVSGRWLDGTFGAGGYTRGLLAAGADHVTGVDRDPLAFDLAKPWIDDFAGRITLQAGVFSRMDEYASDLDGVVLDLGVSSMQLDLAERGFSFMKEGPLDMRMSQDGPSAADLVAELTEVQLADIIFNFGEERASRRIAKAIVRERAVAPITTTLQLAEIVASCLPRPKPNQSHPATRTFQALRIAVNAEYEELYEGLLAAERALKPGGLLAVVTFHSVEDRMVKRFFQHRAGKTGRANRWAPELDEQPAQFELVTRKAVGPDDDELAQNPRSRSARLRVGRRTDAAPAPISGKELGMPQLKETR
ncbi:Ribosomal RNA small subunit methyltransferase H [Tritonibacter multivorans]|uniref:Ribosomal RNA small subunit methyltransferase H n=1 Tax=Tritonibacter multivorans TaxID=928856 RepID=A0A0P1GEW4_9RHOB|nr:16S rRNA (cytosine(1402)-N(4))-methyltransferase RsmH [Tritonibacter multivorans]MDA7421060.1 16S rRNA (cytosine(1402)-N(4))-methyltransferase RsmH [Tritonibacter multivorans]CUH80259.1 Ribosomal RNA small subunit methyltransferase H [Tritonibacter multivorans]SFC76763.1 16S rRNA (cytosine1402-N4)-methyltransferase [Tritonibacter multivorans]